MNKPTTRHVHIKDFDLWLLPVAVIGLGLSIYLAPLVFLRVFFGMLMFFYIPGYALLAALYVGEEALDRKFIYFASPGLSLIVTAVLGMAVSRWVRTTLETAFFSLAAWVAIMGLLAIFRRAREPGGYRYQLVFNINSLYEYKRSAAGKWRALDHKPWVIVYAALAIVLVLSAGRLLWVSWSVRPQFSEFYLPGQDGLEQAYPQQAAPGDTLAVRVGITNREGRPVHYGLAYDLGSGQPVALESAWVSSNQRWTADLPVAMPDAGSIYKVTFLFWDLQSGEILDRLHLWVDVSDLPE